MPQKILKDKFSSLLGPADRPGVPESAYLRLHAGGTENLLAAAAAQPVAPRVLHSSSPGVLGPRDRKAPFDQDTREDDE